jgi:hypothetical protein
MAEEPPRSVPNVVTATNLNEYGEPDYGEPEYGEPEYAEADYGEPEYSEAPYDGYVAPSEVSPTCTGITTPAASNFVPDHFRPLF